MKQQPPFLISFVAHRDGRLVGYASGPHLWSLNHAVAETDEDMFALLTGAGNSSDDPPLSLLLPARQANLFRWSLKKGMKVLKPMTLMTMSEYQEPKGNYLTPVLY